MTQAEVRSQFTAARVMKMMVRSGYNLNLAHSAAYEQFSWVTFVDELINEVAAAALGERCDRCGSSGDVIMLCAGCHSPLTRPAIQPQTSPEHQSAPAYAAAHNSGEGDPSVMPDYVGADTAIRPQRMRERIAELQYEAGMYQSLYESLWVCSGCGTRKSIEQIKGETPQAISCCPEREMVPAHTRPKRSPIENKGE